MQWATLSTHECRFPGGFNVLPDILRILGWRASFKGWHKIIQISSSGQPLITPSPESKVFFVARREIWHGQNLFSHRHYRSRAVTLFPPHLKRRASAPPSVFPPFCLSKVSHQLEAFLTGQSLKHSNKLHWPTALPPTPCSESRTYFKLLKIHTPSFIMR